jgi:hypothetical protein
LNNSALAIINHIYLLINFCFFCFLCFVFAAACERGGFTVVVRVKNDGPVSGHHSVLLFSKHALGGVNGAPLKQLVNFESIHLDPAAEQDVMFTINPCNDLSLAGMDGIRKISLGKHTLMVGEVEHQLLVVSCTTTLTMKLCGPLKLMQRSYFEY